MMWILLVVALTGTGQSVASHEFPSKDICIAVKHNIEHQLPSARAVCIEDYPL